MLTERFEMFSSLLNRSSKSILKLKKTYMEQYQLSAAHTNVLLRLWRAGEKGKMQGDLIKEEQMDRAQVSRVLKELECHGYAVSSGEGCYKATYRVTEKGAQSAKEVEAILHKIMESVSGELTEEELSEFYRILTIIADNLDQALKEV